MTAPFFHVFSLRFVFLFSLSHKNTVQETSVENLNRIILQKESTIIARSLCIVAFDRGIITLNVFGIDCIFGRHRCRFHLCLRL